MRPIIVALAFATLTACTADPPATRADAPGAAAGAPAESASAADGASSLPRAARTTGGRTVVFIGTSLTAGYGVGEQLAYPAVVQQKIDSAGLPFRVVNAGISGETSAGGLRRIDWTLQHPADVLVVELGANDALRGLDPGQLRANLARVLGRARELYPDIALVLIGMQAPPNLGDAYTAAFRRVYTDLAREYDAALVPFLLDDVAAEPSRNIADGIHPNVEGHRILAATVWRTLEPVLRRRASQPAAAAS